MKKHLIHASSYLLLLLALLLLQACGGRKTVEPTVIPSDATFVVAFDLKQISNKVTEFDDFLDADFLRDLLNDEESSSIAAKLFKSGVDLNKTAYFFSKVDKADLLKYFGATFKIKNSKGFEKTIRNSDKKAEIVSEGEVKYASYEDVQEFIIAWKGDNAVLLATRSAKDLKKKVLEILNTKKAEALEAKNKEFKSALSREFDLLMWVDYQQILDAGAEDMSRNYLRDFPATIQGYTKMTKYITSNIVFNKGSINMKTKTYLDEAAVKKYKFDKLIKRKIDKDLVNGIPIEKPICVMSIGFAMEVVKELLEESGGLKDAELAQKLLGITNDEMFDMFSGDVSIALKSISVKDVLTQDFQYVVGLGIDNKKTLQKLLDKMSVTPFLRERKGYYEVRSGYLDSYIIPQSDYIYITGSELIKDQAVSGKNKIDAKYTKVVRSSNVSFYLNIQKMMALLDKEYINTDENLKMIMEDLKPESLSVTSKPYRYGAIEAEAIFEVGNKRRNILAILMDISKATARNTSEVNL